MPKKIPQKILDATLKDTIFTDQYSVGLNRQVQQLLIATENEIAAAIAKNDPTAPSMTKWKAARLEKLQSQISDIVKTGYKDISSLTSGELTTLAKTQAKNVVSKFNGAVGADLFSVTLTPDSVKSIVQNTLVDGSTIKQWWDKQSTDTQQRLSSAMAAGTQALQIGLVQAETVGDLIGRIRGTALTPGVMSISKREATALVRTSVMQVANVTRQETYKANSDVLDGFEFIATLDARTCSRCRPYDSKKYDMNMQPIGHELPFPGTPLHFQCRCTTAPVTRSWAELAGTKEPQSKVFTVEGMMEENKGQKVNFLASRNPSVGQLHPESGEPELAYRMTTIANGEPITHQTFDTLKEAIKNAESMAIGKADDLYWKMVPEVTKSPLSKSLLKELDNIPVGERASMNGPISGNVTYDGWLKTQSVDVQKEILGPGRYKLWSENKLDSVDLVNNNGTPLTIKELQTKLGTDVTTSRAELIREAEKVKVANESLAAVDKDRVADFISECYIGE